MQIGIEMEPVVLDEYNQYNKKNFTKVLSENYILYKMEKFIMTGVCDAIDQNLDQVLEIKTGTSERIITYRDLIQVQCYMFLYNVNECIFVISRDDGIRTEDLIKRDNVFFDLIINEINDFIDSIRNLTYGEFCKMYQESGYIFFE